jgi:hypothetical protein
MTTVAAFTRPEVDLETIGRRGYIGLQYKVHGFWSEPITLYVRREGRFDGDRAVHEWSFEVNNSSGGRDTEVEPDNAVAMTNFAHAILDAVALGQELMAQVDTLNHHHNLAVAERDAQREVERREHEEQMAADPALGEENAKRLLSEVREMAKSGNNGLATLVIYHRGSNACNRIVANNIGGNSMRYTMGRDQISRKNLLSMLEKASHRTHIEI